MLGLGNEDVLNECFPCSCVSGADSEEICIVEIEILCVKSFVFHVSIDGKFYNFDTFQCAFFVILEKLLSLIAV